MKTHHMPFIERLAASLAAHWSLRQTVIRKYA
jgi:hypothetical protein